MTTSTRRDPNIKPWHDWRRGERRPGWEPSEWHRRATAAYPIEEQLLDQLGKLPNRGAVRDIFLRLPIATLRELSVEVFNDSVVYAKNRVDRVKYITALNSWMATAEETVAASGRTSRIAARRAAGR